jgi:GntR family transcriptional regulator, transcriptional repressor for pyruvate dehydrogenase complex
MTAVAPAPRLYHSVIDRVIELITDRRLRPGDALPTERELAALLGVSRNVLREAFRVLEERGLIVTRQGAGRFLRELPTDDRGSSTAQRDRLERASIADVLEARAMLEEEIVALACQRRTTGEAEELSQLAGRLEVWEDNLRFHRFIASATHNFMLIRMVEEQVELLNDLDQRGHYPQQASAGVIARQRAEHAHIAAAILDRDERMARRLIREHVRYARDAVLRGDGDPGPDTP